MKRKIVVIMIMILMIITSVTINSFAVENVEMNLTGDTTIEEGTTTVELILSIGSMTTEADEESVVLAYQATLEYDESIVEDITVEGLNGWNAEYANNTLLCDTSSATANTNIAKITLTLVEGLEAGEDFTISLTDGFVTDGTNDFDFNSLITVTVVESSNTSEEDDNTDEDDTTNSAQTNSTNIQEINTDTTTASTILPAAGIKSALFIVLGIAIILAVVFKIKSRDIKY